MSPHYGRRRRNWIDAHGSRVDAPESRRTTQKIGRNDRCPCGSGKKYKKCCGGATVN